MAALRPPSSSSFPYPLYIGFYPEASKATPASREAKRIPASGSGVPRKAGNLHGTWASCHVPEEPRVLGRPRLEPRVTTPFRFNRLGVEKVG